MIEQPRIQTGGLTQPGVGDVHPDQFLIAELSRALEVEASSVSLMDDNRLRSSRRGKVLILADGHDAAARSNDPGAVAVSWLVNQLLDDLAGILARDGLSGEALVQRLEKELIKGSTAASPDAKRSGDGKVVTLGVVYIVDDRVYAASSGRCHVLRHDGSRLHHLCGMDEHTSAGLARIDPGDTLVLASSGLWDALGFTEISNTLEAGAQPETTCRWLVSAATREPSGQNMTAVVARAEDEVPQPAAGRRRPTPLMAARRRMPPEFEADSFDRAAVAAAGGALLGR